MAHIIYVYVCKRVNGAECGLKIMAKVAVLLGNSWVLRMRRRCKREDVCRSHRLGRIDGLMDWWMVGFAVGRGGDGLVATFRYRPNFTGDERSPPL
jgi:hypothetical protein